MSSVKEIFASPKPMKRNFIRENVRHLRELERYRQLKEENKDVRSQVPANTKFLSTERSSVVASHITYDKRGSKPISIRNTKSAQPENLPQNNHGKRTISAAQGNTIHGRSATVARGNQRVDAITQKTSDIAKYVQTQQANVFGQQKDGKGLSGSSLSLDLSSLDNVQVTKYPSSVTHRTTGCQTMHPDDLDKIEDEGVIRFPTARKELSSKLKPVNKKNIHTKTTYHKIKENGISPPPMQAGSLTRHDDQLDQEELELEVLLNSKELNQDAVDFIRMNAQAVASAAKPSAPMINPLAAPPTYRKGVVPKYLQKRQEEWQKENDQKLLEASDPACPAGYKTYPEAEREEMLTMLRKNYGDFVQELNMMPVRTDTLRMRQKKIELEKKLDKLEDGIKVFSRPKVFVEDKDKK